MRSGRTSRQPSWSACGPTPSKLRRSSWGVLCGVGGFLYVSRAGGASPNVGATFTLPAFAAAFLSAAAVRPGRFNVWGLVIAVYFLAVLNNGLNLAGVEPYVNDWVNGGALIIGVALATVLYRRRTT